MADAMRALRQKGFETRRALFPVDSNLTLTGSCFGAGTSAVGVADCSCNNVCYRLRHCHSIQRIRLAYQKQMRWCNEGTGLKPELKQTVHPLGSTISFKLQEYRVLLHNAFHLQ